MKDSPDLQKARYVRDWIESCEHPEQIESCIKFIAGTLQLNIYKAELLHLCRKRIEEMNNYKNGTN